MISQSDLPNKTYLWDQANSLLTLHEVTRILKVYLQQARREHLRTMRVLKYARSLIQTDSKTQREEKHSLFQKCFRMAVLKNILLYRSSIAFEPTEVRSQYRISNLKKALRASANINQKPKQHKARQTNQLYLQQNMQNYKKIAKNSYGGTEPEDYSITLNPMADTHV